MFIEIGPAFLVITGEKDRTSYDFDEKRLAARVTALLADIRESLPVLKQRAWRIKNTSGLAPVARKMVMAAKGIDEQTLTPVAAVAGAVADELKEYLQGEGLEFVSVNNGGDIAVYNGRPRPVSIGIGDIRTGRPTPYLLRITALVDFGVATSGFGGRSFTLGLADMVSVVAPSAPFADAAATWIGNHTNVDDDAVERRRAAEIDPYTDIPEEWVTVRIGALAPGSVREALARGREAAGRLKREGRIREAVILLRGEMVTTIYGQSEIQLEVKDGNPQNGDGRGGYFS